LILGYSLIMEWCCPTLVAGSIDVAHQQHVSDNEAISRGFQISASLMGYGR